MIKADTLSPRRDQAILAHAVSIGRLPVAERKHPAYPRATQMKTLICCLLLAAAAIAPARAETAVPRYMVVATNANDLADFLAASVALCSNWFPVILEKLPAPGWTAPEVIRLKVRDDMSKGTPAATGGREIGLNHAYFRRHSDDTGAVIHELTHIIQHYPKYYPVWLVEGVADYIRFCVCFPNPQDLPASAAGRSYQDGYRTVAAFLWWLEQKKSPGIVAKLHADMQNTRYRDALFQEYSGQTLDELWKEFQAVDIRKDLFPPAK
jgi:hypothetical protein